MRFSTKSFKKLFLLGTVSVSIFGVVGCGNDSIKNTEGDTKDNTKQVTKTDAQKNDELKEKVKADADKVAEEKGEKSKETNDNTPYYKETNDDGIPVYMEEYEKIGVGMPANKVKELIGKPSDIEKYKSYSLYRYGGWDSEGAMVVYFDTNGTVTKKEQKGLRYQPDDFERNYGVKREDVQATSKKAEREVSEEEQRKEIKQDDYSPYNTDVNEQSHLVSLDMFESIKVGMTADQVTEIVGTSPRTIEDYKKEIVFGYTGNGNGAESYMLLTFDLNYKLIKKDAKGLVYPAVKSHD
ncbi:hypothetical protein [Bacillus mycoides]|uniref:hypothetical protein n=1 Tax=Bacillus mycoides TaxID=1405 RepID=UPI003D65934D